MANILRDFIDAEVRAVRLCARVVSNELLARSY